MICSICGAQNDDNDIFCGNCGAPLGAAPAKAPRGHRRRGLFIGITAAVVVVAGLAAGALVYFNTGARLAGRQAAQGRKYLDAKQYRPAEQAFEKAIGSDKEDADAYVGLAEAYSGLKDTQKAEQSLKNGIKAVPQAETLYIRLSGLYVNDGNLDSALQILKTGIAAVNSQSLQAMIKTVQAKLAADDTMGNISNSGTAAQQDGWIYYTNFADNGYLYKVSTDGTGKTRLNRDYSEGITVVNGWVYYSDYIADEYSSFDPGPWFNLYKVRTDGTGRTQVLAENADFVNISNGWIYYSKMDDNYTLWKVRLDGTGKTELYDGETSGCEVSGGFIYYAAGTPDRNNLYRMRLDGTGKTKLSDNVIVSFNASGGWVYYTNFSDGDNLYKMRADGTGNTKLDDGIIQVIDIAGNWIYYKELTAADDQSGSFYRIHPDGTGLTRVS